MKSLKDLSLNSVGSNLHGNISQIVAKMASIHKEMLLERLICHDRLTDEYLPHVTYNLFSKSLRHVVFNRSYQITDAVLEQLSESECELITITIHACPNITDKGILAITRGQTKLEKFALRKQKNVSHKAFKELKSDVLCKVDFRGSEIKTEAVQMVLKSNCCIKNLILSECKGMTEKVFTTIAETLTDSLEVLKVRNLNILSDSNLAKIAASCPNITKLNLYGCTRISEVGLEEVIKHLKKLQILDVSYCGDLKKKELLQVFSGMPADSLRHLSLSGIMFDDSDLFVAAIQRLTNLKAIRLCIIPAVTDSALEKILSSIGGNLELLDLSGGLMSTITNEGLRSVERYCTNLKELNLSMLLATMTTLVPMFRDETRARKFTALQLSCRNLDEDVAHYISRFCINLKQLTFSGVPYINDAILISVAETCRELLVIGLKGCREVTDESVCALARYCTGLEVVVLSGIRNLTDKSVMALANSCPLIREIYLSGCDHVTRDAIWYLVESSIPRVFFEHRTSDIRFVSQSADFIVSNERL